MRAIKHWNKLARKVVKTFKATLGGTLSNLVSLKILVMAGGWII